MYIQQRNETQKQEHKRLKVFLPLANTPDLLDNIITYFKLSCRTRLDRSQALSIYNTIREIKGINSYTRRMYRYANLAPDALNAKVGPYKPSKPLTLDDVKPRSSAV